MIFNYMLLELVEKRWGLTIVLEIRVTGCDNNFIIVLQTTQHYRHKLKQVENIPTFLCLHSDSL